MTIKREYPFVLAKRNPAVHPPLFQSPNKNLATDFNEFLDTVKRLNPKLHQDFILACHHYARTAKEVGVDSEMVFIRLVPAIEALSIQEALNCKDDAQEERAINDLLAHSGLPQEQKRNLKNIFNVRKSSKKFVRVIRTALQWILQGRLALAESNFGLDMG